MFLNCPAYLDHDGAVRCGLPAEVRCRFTMRSTDGPVESAMIRCPAGHYFSGAIESLTWDGTDHHGPGSAAVTSSAGRDSVQRSHDGRDGGDGFAARHSPPSRSGEIAARTLLPHTIWATRPPCGSPPCARAAGAPPPVTRWKPPSAAVTQPGTPACSSTADSPVIGTGHGGCAPRPGQPDPTSGPGSAYPVPCPQPAGCAAPRTRQTSRLSTGCPRGRLAQRSG